MRLELNSYRHSSLEDRLKLVELNDKKACTSLIMLKEEAYKA